MSGTKEENQDPTESPKFKRVVDHFLKTPPKHQKPGGKDSLTESDDGSDHQSSCESKKPIG